MKTALKDKEEMRFEKQNWRFQAKKCKIRDIIINIISMLKTNKDQNCYQQKETEKYKYYDGFEVD
jgi:hypothetical protein